MKRLVCLGLSHRTAPVELRERLSAMSPGAAACPAVSEHAVLSTCYRVELYASMEHEAPDARDVLIDVLADAHRVDPGALAEHLYVYGGSDAARHLARVAAGLDSLVLGESEILGQISGAYDASRAAGTTGPVLELLFRSAVTAGRRARAETAIGANPATASSMGLALAQGVVGDLRERRVLVVGAGRIGLQTLKALASRRIEHVAVANRTVDRAEEVAARFGATAYGLDRLAEALSWSDVVVSATGSQSPVIDVVTIRRAAEARNGLPLVLVDLAVPADVEREAADVDGVSLFDVDDLRAGLDETQESRMREIPGVEKIVEEEVEAFDCRLRELAVAPVVAELRQRADEIREQELERTLRHLGDVDPAVEEHVRHLSRSLVNKLLHEPTVRLRERAGSGDADEFVEAARDLFGLPVPREP